MSRVLSVDDSETVRSMIINGLERTRQPIRDIVEGATSRDAMDRFRDGTYHVVFLDLVLVEGERTVELLAAMLKLKPQSRIVIVTAVPADDADVIRALGIGAYAHLAKPVRVEALRHLMEQIDHESADIVRIR